MVKKDGENVLRWAPAQTTEIDFKNCYERQVPELKLSWLP